MKNNLFELMEKYNLTLRRLPDTETITTSLPNNPTKEELNNAFESVINEMPFEKFKQLQDKGYMKNCRWNNGYVIGKFTSQIIQRAGGWIVKQDNGHGSNQTWQRKYDYFGKTPKEAIENAVKDIEEKKEKANERKRLAELNNS